MFLSAALVKRGKYLIKNRKTMVSEQVSNFMHEQYDEVVAKGLQLDYDTFFRAKARLYY